MTQVRAVDLAQLGAAAVAPAGLKDERESSRCARALEEAARATEEEMAAMAAHEAEKVEALEKAAATVSRYIPLLNVT